MERKLRKFFCFAIFQFMAVDLGMVTEELTKDGISIPDFIDQIPAPLLTDMNELEVC